MIGQQRALYGANNLKEKLFGIIYMKNGHLNVKSCMRYSGSKSKIAKYIIPFIMKELKPGNAYIEPFVGGCNMIDKVDWPWKIGYDINGYVISMWSWLKGRAMNPFPKHVSEEDYYAMKKLAETDSSDKNKYPAFLLCSFQRVSATCRTSLTRSEKRP